MGEENQCNLGIFPVTRYPILDRERATRVRRLMTRALTQSEPVADVRDATLASLIQPAGWRLMNRLVSREERRTARQRAKALSKGEAMSSDS